MINKATGFEINGTSYHGQVLTFTYNQLVKVFGHPNAQNDDDKIQYCWFLKVDDVPFTIYNWHDYFTNQNKLIDWHIGSKIDPLSHDLYIKIKNYILVRI